MSKAGELYALAERCERATGPDRELDKLIAPYAGWKEAGKVSVLGSKMPAWLPPGKSGSDSRVIAVPHFTASLDAAMSLAPVTLQVGVLLDAIDACQTYEDSWLADLPRFICAASLRARAAQEAE